MKDFFKFELGKFLVLVALVAILIVILINQG